MKAVSERFRQFENTKPRAQKLGTKKIFTLVSLKKIIAMYLPNNFESSLSLVKKSAGESTDLFLSD